MGAFAAVAIGVALVGVVLIVIGLRSPGKQDTLESRLAELGAMDRPPTLEEIELSMPFSERVVRPVLRKIAELVARAAPAQSIERTRRKLELASLLHRIGPAEFLAVRYILAVVVGGAALVGLGAAHLPTPQMILLVPTVTALGFFLPVLWLGSKTRARQRDIQRSLPDALDLLTICVEAGLGFDAAMAKVAEKWQNELSRAFSKVLQEIQLGKIRREALRNMADTMEVPDVTTFVAAVIQADQLGVSIAKVLRIQSNEMRVRRRLRAEEQARSAPVKLMIPIAFLIFPSLFIVLLGPSVIILKNSALAGLF